MITGNELAFPSDIANPLDMQGLTIRQHFAAMAMQGMLANPECFTAMPKSLIDEAPKIYAIAAVEHADALIEELNKTTI